jgi:signal transduction histidine kinase
LEEYMEGDIPFQRLANLSGQLAESVGSQLTLLDIQGNPLYDSHVDFSRLGNQSQQSEVQGALTRSAEYDIRIDPVSGEERLYTAAPVLYEGSFLGIVQLSTPTQAMWSQVGRVWMSLLGTGLAVVAVTIVVSFWLASSILKPIRGLQAAAIDITAGNLDRTIPVSGKDELGDLAQAFNTMTARLRHLIRQQRDFVANASHELRTPLTTIRLRVEALLGGARQNPELATQFLTEIEGEVDRLSQLVDALLVLSRVEAGLDSLSMTPIDISFLLDEAMAVYRPRVEAAGHQLILDVEPGLPPVRAASAQIRQVIDNLLENALKYSPSGGFITLSCRKTGDAVTVSVTDTGYGIPAQDLPHVFERFYRADKARTRSGGSGGTGLGLSIVRSVVLAHGGQVSIDSQEGKGTTVRFTLPLHSHPAPMPGD